MQMLKGYRRVPSQEEQNTLLQIIEYLNRLQGLKFTEYHKDLNDEFAQAVTADTLPNARGPKRTLLSALAFEAFATKCFQECQKHHKVRAKGFTIDDNFFRFIIIPFFPDLTPIEPALDENSGDPLKILANPSSFHLSRIAREFENGAYVYRYAFNDEIDPDEGLHLARGHLRMEHIPSGHLSFSIDYEAGTSQSQASSRKSGIEGAAYLIGAFVCFSGLERSTPHPFFMIIRDEFNSNQNGGLILRKHPDKGFFSSKVIIVRTSEAEAAELPLKTGSLPISDMPEINNFVDFLDDLTNVGNNDGKGVLTLPYRLR